MMNLWKNSKIKVRFNEPLKRHTTFRIGGPCRYFFQPKDTAQLKILLNGLKRDKIPFLILGAGSNLLVSDAGLRQAVIRLDSVYFRRIKFRDGFIEAGAGCLLVRLINFALNLGLGGTEFLTGIPGTVGGALLMNAGQRGEGIGSLVEDINVIDRSGNIKCLRRKDLKFGYRWSNLSRYIVLSARFKLFKVDAKASREKIKGYLHHRRICQDWSMPSAGCIFKNPQGDSAGRLIDLCGLKGFRVHDAAVSSKHANFILNLGNASSRDVLELLKLVQKKVRNKFKIDLKTEIKVWR